MSIIKRALFVALLLVSSSVFASATVNPGVTYSFKDGEVFIQDGTHAQAIYETVEVGSKPLPFTCYVTLSRPSGDNRDIFTYQTRIKDSGGEFCIDGCGAGGHSANRIWYNDRSKIYALSFSGHDFVTDPLNGTTTYKLIFEGMSRYTNITITCEQNVAKPDDGGFIGL